MRKLFLAAAAGLGLSAATASAQIGPAVHEMHLPAGPAAGCADGNCGTGGCADGACGKYGTNLLLKKLMWWKKDECKDGKACKDGKGCKGKGCGSPPPGAIGGPPVGTLVFPVNPYTRSPRDYFMFGQGGY